MGEKRSRSFYVLAAFFAAYVLFLYGPMIAIYILSFQGLDGGLTFPMNGVSLVWFSKVFSGAGIVDIGAAFKRSLVLGLVVMILTVVLSVSAGMAFRKSFRGASVLFYVAIASLIMPSIITSLGIALEFRLLDDFITVWQVSPTLFAVDPELLTPLNRGLAEAARATSSADFAAATARLGRRRITAASRMAG